MLRWCLVVVIRFDDAVGGVGAVVEWVVVAV